jgi:hypothetical protein
MPLVIVDRLSAEKTNRMISARGPEWKFRGLGETLDNFRMRRLLKNNHIGCGSNNRFPQRLLAPQPPKPDVVAE